jgi:hypothetical protein
MISTASIAGFDYRCVNVDCSFFPCSGDFDHVPHCRTQPLRAFRPRSVCQCHRQSSPFVCYCRPMPLWRLISQLLNLFRSGCHWPSPPTTGKLELSIGQINFYRLEVNPMEVPQLLSARVSRRKLPEGRADES